LKQIKTKNIKPAPTHKNRNKSILAYFSGSEEAL